MMESEEGKVGTHNPNDTCWTSPLYQFLLAQNYDALLMVSSSEIYSK